MLSRHNILWCGFVGVVGSGSLSRGCQCCCLGVLVVIGSWWPDTLGCNGRWIVWLDDPYCRTKQKELIPHTKHVVYIWWVMVPLYFAMSFMFMCEASEQCECEGCEEVKMCECDMKCVSMWNVVCLTVWRPWCVPVVLCWVTDAVKMCWWMVKLLTAMWCEKQCEKVKNKKIKMNNSEGEVKLEVPPLYMGKWSVLMCVLCVSVYVWSWRCPTNILMWFIYW